MCRQAFGQPEGLWNFGVSNGLGWLRCSFAQSSGKRRVPYVHLGLKGPRSKPITLQKTPNVYVVDCSARIDSHGGYRNCSQYYDHWKLVLAGGPMDRYDELS